MFLIIVPDCIYYSLCELFFLLFLFSWMKSALGIMYSLVCLEHAGILFVILLSEQIKGHNWRMTFWPGDVQACLKARAFPVTHLFMITLGFIYYIIMHSYTFEGNILCVCYYIKAFS